MRNNLLFLGSTILDVNDRFKEHIRDMSKYPNCTLYKAMQQFGLDILDILLIEQVNVQPVQDLWIREGDYVALFGHRWKNSREGYEVISNW